MDSNPIEEGHLGRAGFGKQRRNLLVISVLLATGLWVGPSLEQLSKITIFGNELSLSRPGGLAHIAWMVWLYFLIRYIGFHLQYQKSDEKFVFLFRINLKNAHRAIIVPEAQKQGVSFRNNQVEIIRTTFLGDSCYLRRNSHGGESPWEEVTLSISPTATWFARIKVLAKVIFGVAVTSEYYLPHLVALLPVVLLLIR